MTSSGDPFLASRYAGLNDTDVERKLRRLRPWPVGVVFIERPPGWLAGTLILIVRKGG